MRLFSLVPATLICAAGLFACSETPDPNNPANVNPNAGYGAQYGYPQGGQVPPGYPTAGPNQPPPGYPTATAPYPTAPAPTGPAPAPTGPAPASGGGSAQPISPALAGAAGMVLNGLAKQHAAGMTPSGQPFAGNFQPGQTLEQPLTIQPGKCYAIVGVGVGIQELNVQLVYHQPPLPPVVAAQDKTTGPQAIISSANCYKVLSPIPIAGKVVMTAASGAGVAAAQVYIK